MRIKETIKEILINRENKRYEKTLAKKKVSYHVWVAQDEAAKQVPFSEKQEDYVIWKLKGGKLSKCAIAQLNACFLKYPQAQLLYGDEDVWEAGGERTNPWAKPCWSPDTYLSYFYVGSVMAVKKSLLEAAGITTEGNVIEYEQTAEIRELMDKLFTVAGAFEKGTKAVERVPYVLYHAKSASGWDTHFASASAIEEEKPLPKVSVIIPSKDNPALLKQCLEALAKQKAELEIIVVDNGSNVENRAKIEELTKGMRYIYDPKEFNFSYMCNTGAKAATGSVLLFLNDDVEVLENDWLQRMCNKAQKPYVGAVGLKLYYPGGNLMQHVGVANMPVGPDHKLRTLPDDRDYYFGWNVYTHNGIATTGACFMIEADKYREVGGFSEELAVCYNDVDVCFKLYEKGYQNVTINEAYAYHHESISRGTDESPEKFARFVREWNKLYELHPALKEEDPYFPAELDRLILNNKVQPAYVHGINVPQQPAWKPYKDMGKVRYDDCLMARVETYDEKKIKGYGIVLWDDNACYKQYLIMCPDLDSEIITPDSMMMELEGMYKYELEENVPDQKNVGLSGFYISREGEQLQSGKYKPGILAVNKVTGLKLFSWCGKVLEL